MTYKRYITRKGKRLGPYYYKSVRLPNGKIKSVYIGNKRITEEKQSKNTTKFNSDVYNRISLKGDLRDYLLILVALLFILGFFLL